MKLDITKTIKVFDKTWYYAGTRGVRKTLEFRVYDGVDWHSYILEKPTKCYACGK